MAQKQSDHFLADVFAVRFKINTPLKDIQNNKEFAENLSFRYKMDNSATYRLVGQQINLPGLHSLDRFAFDTLELIFENNKLHDVWLDIPREFKDRMFTKTCGQFNAKYGRAEIVNQKMSNYKKYVWNLGTNKIELAPIVDGLVIHYGSKLSDKKIGWIYSDRKGEGNGTIQLNLHYFEKLLGEKLTVSSFEKVLPHWETSGVLNHVAYDLNFRTLNADRATFSVTYSLSNYNLEVRTVDTTSKVINEFTLDKIKDANVWSQFEKDLVNSHYVMGPKIKYLRNITYGNHKFMVFLDKEDSRISIENDFKNKLP